MHSERLVTKNRMIAHIRFVNSIGKLLIVFPGLYVILLVLVPPLLLGGIVKSFPMGVIALIGHAVFLLTVPGYLLIWRTISYGFRVMYTMLWHRFLFHLSQSRDFGTMYADLSGIQTIEAFYQAKTRSVRRRMLHSIPEKMARAGVEVRCVSSNRISLEHLKIQYEHSRKYATKAFDLYMLVFGFFTLVGSVMEYRIRGKLIGQGLGFVRGETYTICIYGALEEAAHIGLWFYNIVVHLRYAIALDAKFVNGTLEIHKPEAKEHVGLVAAKEEDLVSRLYGGSLFSIPGEYHGNLVSLWKEARPGGGNAKLVGEMQRIARN